MNATMIALVVSSATVGVVAGQTFRADVEVVRMDVSVTRDGRPVAGLTKDDFIATDDGAPQTIDAVRLDDVPLSVQLVLDTSLSVQGGRLTALIKAGDGLLGALRPSDHAGLVTFSDSVAIRARMTPDLASVRRSLGGIKGEGQTAVRDAVQLALAATHDSDARPMMLLFTDGADNASWLTEEDVLESAHRSGGVTHIVRSPARDELRSNWMEDLVDATGGRIWSATSQRDLAELFSRALAEMRARYLVSYTPTAAGKRGWHDVKIRLGGRNADVLARPGYFKP
ncbi:MAG: VWA domain-containing protein [Acidimicrobiia bacterium]|nr:VWA domain-containing protein [Acidimicrobiia bacterium]